MHYDLTVLSGTTTPPSGRGPLYFERCAEAWEAGEAPIERGEPGYRDELDQDKDGTACEPSPEIAPSTTSGPVE
ncbi:excalibur calcium-binding domain-containing protein [Streptodolium elevatio]